MYSSELGMRVVIHSESQVEGAAKQERLLRQTFSHAPAQSIIRTRKFAAVRVPVISHYAKLYMFLFQYPSRLNQLRIPGNENGHGIA